MDKQAAVNLINNTFNYPFDEHRFSNFARNLLDDIDESKIFAYHGAYIPDSFKSHVKKYKRLGKYKDSEGNTLDILIVHLERETALERARTMQRNFIAWYLNGGRGDVLRDAALVAFASPDPDDWRFSYVRMEYKGEVADSGKIKVTKELTPARRYSFLVGKNEPNHTARRQLLPLLQKDSRNPTLSQLEDAFSVETVTREFFLKYRDLFIRTKEALDTVMRGNIRIEADFDAKGVNTVDFAKKLLGQIIFLYFLQKKGWFGVGRDADWGTGSKHFLRELFEKKHGGYDNFFNDILEPLFYQALRLDRRHDDDYYDRFNCKIPFLNGGLFDPIGNNGGYDWVHTDIHLPDSLFSNNTVTKEGDEGDGILDAFDRYNFTVKEDEPLEKEVAIDPELLGKAYEKFNAIRPDNFEGYKKALKGGKKGDETKFNKQFGVYYTPREIVHYMCRESLIDYLYTEVGASFPPPLTGEDKGDASPDKSFPSNSEIRPITREDIETLIHTGEHIGENEEAALLKARNITEGKQKTSDYMLKLPESIRANAKLIDKKLEDIAVCDPAVGSGAFPVGMMSEIVKIRMVLNTFIADKNDRTPYDFKRRCIEHSLYGTDIDPGATEIAKLRLWLSLVVDENDIKNIKPLPNLDYKIVRGNSLLGYPFTPMGLEKIERLKTSYFHETRPAEKLRMKEQIDQAIGNLFKNTHKSLGYTIDFDFNITFSEIFHTRNGFDIVIGNPPYVRQEQIKQYKNGFKELYDCYTGAADIYVYFYEKGLNLLHDGGTLAFITSNKYMRAGYGEKLRRYLSGNATITQLIDFGDAPVFEAASYPSIIILKKAKTAGGYVRALSWERSAPVSRFEQVFQKHNILILQKELTADGWRIESPAVLRLLEKLRKIGMPLGEYVNGRFYYGIKTGLNEAFVVNRATRDRLIAEDPSSAKVLKPFLRGRDVKRWRVNFAEQYLIKIESSENKRHPWSGKKDNEAENIFAETYPAIHAHLESYRDKLIKRDDQGKYFWELRSCKYWREFEQPKIILGRFMNSSMFAFDRKGFFHNDALYMIAGTNEFVVALLNSSVSWWFLKQTCTDLQNGYLQAFRENLFQIPITSSAKLLQVDYITGVVHEIMKSKHLDTNDNVSAMEHELDWLVYNFYGLTTDEVAIVEENKY